jgi:hypothetical protein
MTVDWYYVCLIMQVQWGEDEDGQGIWPKHVGVMHYATIGGEVCVCSPSFYISVEWHD